jgi:hypothetical protein
MKTHVALKTTVLTLAISTFALLGLARPAQCQFTVNLFVTGGNDAIRLADPLDWSVHVEPVGTQFQASDIDIFSIRLISNGTGSVSSIPCRTNKPILISDANNNGIQDANIPFMKPNLQQLFSNFHGHSAKTVVLGFTANLIQGGNCSGTITIDVIPK